MAGNLFLKVSTLYKTIMNEIIVGFSGIYFTLTFNKGKGRLLIVRYSLSPLHTKLNKIPFMSRIFAYYRNRQKEWDGQNICSTKLFGTSKPSFHCVRKLLTEINNLRIIN